MKCGRPDLSFAGAMGEPYDQRRFCWYRYYVKDKESAENGIDWLPAYIIDAKIHDGFFLAAITSFATIKVYENNTMSWKKLKVRCKSLVAPIEFLHGLKDFYTNRTYDVSPDKKVFPDVDWLKNSLRVSEQNQAAATSNARQMSVNFGRWDVVQERHHRCDDRLGRYSI